MSPLASVWSAMSPSPARVAAAVTAGVLALGSGVALTATAAWLISRAAEHPPLIALSVAIVAVRALGIARGVLRYVERLASHDVALRGAVRVREQLYRRVAGAERGTVVGLRRGDLVSRIGPDVELVSDVLVRGAQPFAVAVGVGAASCVVVAWMTPVAGIVLAACLVWAGVASAWFGGQAAVRFHRVAERGAGELVATVHDLLEHGDELNVGGQASDRLARAAAQDAERSSALDEAARPGAWAAASTSAAWGIAMVGGLVVGAGAVRAGTMSAVLLAVVALVPLALADVVTPLPAAAAALVRGSIAAQRLQPLLDARPMTTPVPGARQYGEASAPLLAARGLSCGWPGRSVVVDELDLTLAAGELVAVTGTSGSGKSTLLATLAGLLPPVRGTVCVQGFPVSDWDAERLRRVVTLTAEDAHVFSTTVRDNLLVARGDATDAEISGALDVVGLTDWLSGLPDGLGSPVSPAVMSGGERRRLVVARSLLVGSSLLLLDEPTEHLDPVAAQELLLGLRRHARDRSVAVVVATHHEGVSSISDRLLCM